jgi:MoaE-MoaD fusion protein
MQYRIQVFAGLIQLTGSAIIILEAPEDKMTAAELKSRVIDQYPQAAALLKQSFMAVNHTYALLSQAISPADELAIIPPVSGG